MSTPGTANRAVGLSRFGSPEVLGVVSVPVAEPSTAGRLVDEVVEQAEQPAASTVKSTSPSVSSLLTQAVPSTGNRARAG